MTTSGPIPLNQSVIFNALVNRVTALEAGSAAATGLTLANNGYINTRLSSGSLTRAFGLNGSNSLFIGGIDQTISSIVFEVAQTTFATFSAGNALFGQPVFVGDTNFGLNYNSGTQPYINFDSGDTFSYVRSTNSFIWGIASAGVMTLTSSSALTLGDGNFGLIYNAASEPGLQFDTGDKFVYDRTNNKFRFQIAGTTYLDISTSTISTGITSFTLGDANCGLSFNSGTPLLLCDVGDYQGYVRSTNTFIWDIGSVLVAQMTNAGFGTVGALFPGLDPTYFLNMVSTTPRITFDTNDYLEYNRGSNLFNFVVGGSSVFTLGGAGGISVPSVTTTGTSGLLVYGGASKGSASVLPGDTTHTGSVILQDPSGSQVAGIGPMTATGIFGLINNNGNGTLFSGGPTYFDDLNFSASKVSSNPTITLDTGDTIRYDRAANKFYFAIGGIDVASIDASGNMKLKGTLTQSTTP